MPGNTADKQKEKDADKRSQTSDKKPTEADDTAKREQHTASGTSQKKPNSEQSPRKNSRESGHDEGRLSKPDKDERVSQNKRNTARSGESARGRPTSLRNQSVQPGTRDSEKVSVQPATRDSKKVKDNTQQEGNISLGSRNGTGTAQVHTTSKDDTTGSGRLIGSSIPESLNRDNFDWSNFTYKPIDYVETKSPRVVLQTGPEPCSCYPTTSNRTVSSMLYDKIRCIHCNDIGQTQANVIRFDDGWDDKPETFRKESFQIRSKSLMFGYPRPQFSNVEYDDISMNTITDPKQTPLQNDDTSSILTSVSRMNITGNKSRGINSPEIISQRHDSIKSKTPSVGDISCGIPRIGYTPQPASRQSRSLDRNSMLSGKGEIQSDFRQSRGSERNCISNGQDGIPRDLNKVRIFKGKYFDNATGKIFEYEINPDYQKGANGWQTKREVIQQKEQ